MGEKKALLRPWRPSEWRGTMFSYTILFSYDRYSISHWRLKAEALKAMKAVWWLDRSSLFCNLFSSFFLSPSKIITFLRSEDKITTGQVMQQFWAIQRVKKLISFSLYECWYYLVPLKLATSAGMARSNSTFCAYKSRWKKNKQQTAAECEKSK